MLVYKYRIFFHGRESQSFCTWNISHWNALKSYFIYANSIIFDITLALNKGLLYFKKLRAKYSLTERVGGLPVSHCYQFSVLPKTAYNCSPEKHQKKRGITFVREGWETFDEPLFVALGRIHRSRRNLLSSLSELSAYLNMSDIYFIRLFETQSSFHASWICSPDYKNDNHSISLYALYTIQTEREKFYIFFPSSWVLLISFLRIFCLFF